MKLSIVTDTFPPDINGVAMTLERLSAGLLARGHEVEVIRPRSHGFSGGISQGGFTEIGLPGMAIPGYRMAGLGWARRSFFAKRWSLARPDIIYIATEAILGHAALRAARMLGIPVVSGYHTHFPKYLSGYRCSLLGPLVGKWLRHFHNATDCTLVPAADTRRDLLERGFRNVEILERGVDTVLFNPERRDPALRARWGAGPADPVLLYTGRIAAEKNIALVFQAWEMAKVHYPNTRLVMVGDGPQRAAWQAKHPGAAWTGFLSGVELAEATASADVLLFPSRSETFGNVLLEGMASRLVTVSYHQAASRRFIQPGVNGYAAQRECDDAWLQQFLNALRGRRRWPAIAEAARLTVQPQSWERITQDFENILTRVSGHAAQPAASPINGLPPLALSA